LTNWHPHLHLLVTDGGFRPDGTFVPLPLHDVATPTEAFRRPVLRLFLRRGLLDGEAAQGMLAWPHSGFPVHDGVWVPAADRAFATRLARSCARHPVALSRLAYRADTGTVTYQSGKASGPTAGAETVDALEFLARGVSHIPHKGQVLQRYYGWYANRTRGIRRRAGVPEPAPAEAAEVVPATLADVRRRWAELLRRIVEVDLLRCPLCGDPMRTSSASSPSPASLTGSSTTCAAMRPPPAVRARPPRRRAPARSATSAYAACAPASGSWVRGSSGCTRVGSGGPLVPDPDPARTGGRPVGPAIRAPAPARPPPQPPWTVDSASRTLGGPIEIPIRRMKYRSRAC
jgi:hypothetical protein